MFGQMGVDGYLDPTLVGPVADYYITLWPMELLTAIDEGGVSTAVEW